jgi:hypothetical protein
VFASLALSVGNLAAISRIRELTNAGRELWISRQVLREYLSVVTRPDCPPHPLPPTLSLAAAEYMLSHFRLADEDDETSRTLLQLIKRYGVKGTAIHDCNILAAMIQYKIPALLTDNVKNFKRYTDLVTLLPLR